ncbi:MAG: 50S ribosomal protein L18 [Paludibacteraceae bacterium]|nr:50S ribosomal protein L18 [Paludibacteraceae bacterium]MBR2492323.1 50S ribosomal protein L18 [Paludibacteraceae bacterium]MBR3872176.1 50S ribosomal protein L18 [Paludibacteraceae bacterium]MBR6686489.1 50S ribosomal protein L18 [Paludibacteraceae bacterium]
MIDKIARRLKIKAGVRGKISGTAQKPRMSVFKSNSQIYVQIIDDTAANGGKTLVAESSLAIKEKMTKSEKSAKVGELIAKKAIAAGIETVVFDRNGFLYHGRVKELAEAARKAGLKF